MSLRERARADLERITTNTAHFGWPIVVKSPDGQERAVVGLSGDIGQTIDPNTGLHITGRRAYVSISMGQLEGMTPPRGFLEGPPWLVRFDSVMGQPRTYRVLECLPDEAIGVFTCTLESYRVREG